MKKKPKNFEHSEKSITFAPCLEEVITWKLQKRND